MLTSFSGGYVQDAQSSIQAKNKSTTPLPQFQDKNSCGGVIANGSGMLDLKSTSDQAYSFRARPLNKKIFSSKGDIGVYRNCKKETTVPKEFNLSNSNKHPQYPPTELFSKLSLIPRNHPNMQLEEHPLQVKVLKKNVSLSNRMESKNASALTGKPIRCYGSGGR
ncbi:Protein TPX2, partial [Bienertia sinuspersici]